MYAKLVNGALRRAPNKVTHNNKKVFNPPDNILSELGYYPVKYTDMPTDAPEGQHYESSWQQTETEILQIWTLTDDPVIPEAEPTMSDLVEAVERGINS